MGFLRRKGFEMIKQHYCKIEIFSFVVFYLKQTGIISPFVKQYFSTKSEEIFVV